MALKLNEVYKKLTIYNYNDAEMYKWHPQKQNNIQ